MRKEDVLTPVLALECQAWLRTVRQRAHATHRIETTLQLANGLVVRVQAHAVRRGDARTQALHVLPCVVEDRATATPRILKARVVCASVREEHLKERVA